MSDTFGQMFTRTPSGSHVVCEYDPDVLWFEYKDMAITNPFVDESTVVEVEPSYYGFYEARIGVIHALRLDQPDGRYMLITDETGTALPDMDQVETATLRLYEADGKLLAYCFIGDIP
ncbi:hypothetical protein H8F21_13790 [Pseudomonas sp. P66]|uniref:Uncharacterized protein n=1 Tax=Pseudomonas arcuscaelestis TaxID=2710591 RepID=A0ABS2BYE5_9PSED|nr:hypothetical protein [Pseudomonas arcuscaelestis]MBM5458637.1 hypothetical protein [Pseudomonas arcuscaelestis]